MRELPDDDRLKIMAQVAVTSAIEGQGDVYQIFARMLHRYLADTQPFCTLHDDSEEG
jgi:hypothetical protein